MNRPNTLHVPIVFRSEILNLLVTSRPDCCRFVWRYKINLHYAKANVGGSAVTVMVCVSRKVAGCFFDIP